MSDIKSYTTHNFDAVNDQIHQISKRERARTFAYRLQSFRTIFFYAAGIALIICLLMLCFSWAHRIINAPYPEKEVQIVKPEIIEKEVLKVVQVPVEKSILDSVDNTYKGPTTTMSTTTNTNPNISVVTNFNTFKTAQSPELASYGLSEVTTGWKYLSSEDKYPNLQYCYINKDTGGAWLSSARVVRCWVKSRNERNPYLQLPARYGGNFGGTAGDKPEEGGDDVKSSWPLRAGLHT